MGPAEQLVRMGPAGGPAVLFVPPLFDEANRLRRTIRLAMTALAARGLASILPDLPGQNDSLVSSDAVTLDDWRRALAGVANDQARPIVIASLRGGALIDDGVAAAGWWRLAPADGAGLLRAMFRTRIVGDREAGRTSTMDSLRADARATGHSDLAGYRLSAAMIDTLDAARPAPVAPLRTLTLGPAAAGDTEPRLAGSPMWLRAEPGEDRAMADAMADDLAAWTGQCVNS